MRAWLALLAALLAAAAAAKSIGVPETGPMPLNATHTGYLPLDDDEGGAAMFYAYWESEAGAGPSHPITVWLQVRITDRRRSDMPGELACGAGARRRRLPLRAGQLAPITAAPRYVTPSDCPCCAGAGRSWMLFVVWHAVRARSHPGGCRHAAAPQPRCCAGLWRRGGLAALAYSLMASPGALLACKRTLPLRRLSAPLAGTRREWEEERGQLMCRASPLLLPSLPPSAGRWSRNSALLFIDQPVGTGFR